MRIRLLLCVVSSVLIFLSSVITFAQSSAYNEVYDDNGNLRPQYRMYLQQNPTFSISPSSAAVQLFLDSPMGDSIKALPVQLILTPEEHQTIRLGALQRARALQMFWQDVVIGEQKIFRETQIISPLEFGFAVKSSGSITMRDLILMWQNRSNQDVSFLHGADIVRTKDGAFKVIEDNLGNLGGISDVDHLRNIFKSHLLQKNSGEPLEVTMYANIVYQYVMSVYKSIGKSEFLNNTKIILLQASEPESDNTQTKIDNEYKRSFDSAILALKYLKGKGVIKKYDVVDEKDLWEVLDLERNSSKNNQKILLIAPADLMDMFGMHKIKEIVIDLFSSGRLYSLISPGITVMGNKLMLPFVESFIRYYLNEEPIIQTQETRWFIKTDNPLTNFSKPELEADRSVVNYQRKINGMSEGLRGLYSSGNNFEFALAEGVNLEELNYVFKIGDESQGKGVYLPGLNNFKWLYYMSELASPRRDHFRDVLSDSHWIGTSRLVVQNFADTSFIPTDASGLSWVRFNVDMRPMVFVNGNMGFSHPHIWGRSSLKFPGVLNNVSQGAFELVVDTPAQPLSCIGLFVP